VKYQQDMEKGIILEILKQTIKNAIPTHDRRTTLPHLEFVCGIIFCFIGDINRCISIGTNQNKPD
jgi:hypothetical protein